MANISKHYFEDVCASKLTCKQVWHPWTTNCINAGLDVGLNTIVGSCKFYFVIYMIRIIFNWKKINEKFIKKQLRAYIRTVIYATCLTSSYSLLFCFTRWYLERLSYYSVLIAGASSAFISGFLQPPENMAIDIAIFANVVGETMYGYLHSEQYIRRTKFTETSLFMVFSALLMFLIHTRKNDAKLSTLWFYHPSELTVKQQQNQTSICSHQNSCFDFIYKGVLTYSFCGYLFETAKHILSASPTRFNLKESAKLLLGKKNVFFGLFLGSYVGIYRALICSLRQKNKKDHAIYSIISGFVAGSTYFCQPSIPVLAAAVVTIIKLLFERFPHIEVLKMYIPMTEIVFAVCGGLALHSNCVLRDACPRNVESMLKYGTNGKGTAMFTNFYKTILSLKK